MMTLTDWLAFYGAIVSTFGGAWAMFVHFSRGPKLVVNASPNSQIAGNPAAPKGIYVLFTAYNRGTEPTTLTNIGYVAFKNRWQLWRNRPHKNFVVLTGPFGNTIPYTMPVGGQFLSASQQTPELERLSRETFLYVTFYHSFSDKAVYKRVKPIGVAAAVTG